MQDNSKRVLPGWWAEQLDRSAISRVADSICRTMSRGHMVLYCEVSPDEWREICLEHIGGPWLGQIRIAGIPIRVRRA